MQIIAKETNGKSYNTEKYSFDTIGMPSFDYDDDGSKIMKWQVSGETPRHKKSVSLGDYARQLAGSPPVISYFLDGSRHAYKKEETEIAGKKEEKKSKYFTDNLSKLDKSKRKLVGQIMGIVSLIAPENIAEEIQAAIEKEFR